MRIAVRGTRMPILAGCAAVLLLLAGLGVWGTRTELAGAVIARGTVAGSAARRAVQHAEGGLIREVLARDGDRVSAGQVLLRLDTAHLDAEMTTVIGQLAEVYARRARLIAERDGLDAIARSDLPDFLAERHDLMEEKLAGQRRLFAARRDTVARQLDQFGEQQAQVAQQIVGLSAQLASADAELALVRSEREKIESLHRDRLVTSQRLTDIRRLETRLGGEVGQLGADIGQARARIAALRIDALRLAGARREQAITELRDLDLGLIELSSRRLALEERRTRAEVRAPVSGTIVGAAVTAHTVLQPAETAMSLVPDDLPLQVTSRIDPTDVDQVYPGQPVTLVFTTFNRASLPEVPGRVLRISADVEGAADASRPFYEAVLVPDPAALAARPDLSLLPGMPVEAYIATEPRTAFAYLTEPLAAYANKAFRER